MSIVDHVVFIIKENHSFDNYFGTFPGVNGMAMAHSPNPPANDPDHRHEAWLTRAKRAPRLQFVESDIPGYFSYARQFTLCDNYFTDVAGPSTPNHLMLITADSPLINNTPAYRSFQDTSSAYTLPSLPAALDKAKLHWGNYGGYAFAYIQGLQTKNKFSSAQFITDAAAGKLPAVSWVYAPHENSEHPPDPADKKDPKVGNVTHGMRWTVDQVNAIVQGGLWPKTAIFITWDDWGGYYDHVTPPVIEKWTDGTPFRYGSRVGCLVVGPYVKRGFICHTLYSHVSLLKFACTIFKIAPWNARMQNAGDMMSCFNFTQSPGPPPQA